MHDNISWGISEGVNRQREEINIIWYMEKDGRVRLGMGAGAETESKGRNRDVW
jgi:hypothetical protein